jgi:hypothetical protein
MNDLSTASRSQRQHAPAARAAFPWGKVADAVPRKAADG